MSRKIIFSILLGLFWVLSNPLLAQTQRFKGGVVLGINLSQLDGDRLEGYNRIGLNAGGRVAAVLSDRWQLSMEILYSQRGSNRTTDDGFTSMYESIRINLVEAPLMINFQDWKFHASAGFSYGRLFTSTVKDTFGVDITDSPNEQYSDNVYLIIIGTTFYFTDHIGVNLRWSRSLNDIRAVDMLDDLIDRTISVRGIYMF